MFTENPPSQIPDQKAQAPSEPKKTHWFKRRLLIDVRIQLIFLCHSLTLLIAGMGLLWFHKFLMGFLGIQGLPIYEINWPSVVYFSTGTIMFFLLTLLQLELTNRVFGPIYRLKQHMRKVATGTEITKFSTRKNDLMGDLNDAYNGVLKRLKESEENSKTSVDKGA